jgi:hypothetical protein
LRGDHTTSHARPQQRLHASTVGVCQGQLVSRRPRSKLTLLAGEFGDSMQRGRYSSVRQAGRCPRAIPREWHVLALRRDEADLTTAVGRVKMLVARASRAIAALSRHAGRGRGKSELRRAVCSLTARVRGGSPRSRSVRLRHGKCHRKYTARFSPDSSGWRAG